MKTIKHMGEFYVEAESLPLKPYLIPVLGIDLLIYATSSSSAKQKAVSVLRPSKAWKAKDLKPILVSPAVASKLKTVPNAEESAVAA